MFPVTAHVPAQQYEDYLRALRSADATSVRHVISFLWEQGFTADQVIRDVIVPAQRDVGRSWGASRLSIAEEHQATALAEEALAMLLDPPPHDPVAPQGEVVLFAAEGEWHSIAARMVAVDWRHLGWQVRLVVPSVPARDIAELLGDDEPRFAGVTCAMPASIFGAWRTISALRERGCWVIVGGRGFGSGSRAEHCARVLGADSYAPDAASAHETFVHLRALGIPGQRPGVKLGTRGEEAVRLVQTSFRVVADCVDLAGGLRPGLLVDGNATNQARDDISLFYRSAISAMLVDAQWIMSEHVAWYRQLLLSSGADPELADLWIDTLLSRLPPAARLTREVLATARRS